jgi:hypothetical protein
VIRGKFETQKEIYEALLRGEKIDNGRFKDNYYHLSATGFVIDKYEYACIHELFSIPKNWSIYKEPKKKKTIEVKFYRYHYRSGSVFMFSDWTTENFISRYGLERGYSLLKTEERIEIYEVDYE